MNFPPSNLDADEARAVATYAAERGRSWKRDLADHWANEYLKMPRRRETRAILRGIRNHPSKNLVWLDAAPCMAWVKAGRALAVADNA